MIGGGEGDNANENATGTGGFPAALGKGLVYRRNEF
jgi:hypothetical protein